MKKKSEYPELDMAAQEIGIATAIMVNEKADKIKSEMPYRAQYILEGVIKHLQALV